MVCGAVEVVEVIGVCGVVVVVTIVSSMEAVLLKAKFILKMCGM